MRPFQKRRRDLQLRSPVWLQLLESFELGLEKTGVGWVLGYSSLSGSLSASQSHTHTHIHTQLLSLATTHFSSGSNRWHPHQLLGFPPKVKTNFKSPRMCERDNERGSNKKAVKVKRDLLLMILLPSPCNKISFWIYAAQARLPVWTCSLKRAEDARQRTSASTAAFCGVSSSLHSHSSLSTS